MPIPRSLQDRLRAGRVIPFVGAGVSMSVLDRVTHQPVFPSWRQLLEGAAQRLEQETKTKEANVVRSLVNADPPDFLYAATRARTALGAVWYEFLKDNIDIPFAHIDEESLELARAVWGLGSYLIITTNYDQVLGWACPRQKDLQTWDIKAPAEQALLLQQGLRRPVIWHLHGSISNASQMILTDSDYKLLYPEENHGARQTEYQAALETFRSLTVGKSLLFVGFSLDDESLGMQLKNVNKIYSGAAGPHFALLTEAGAERVRSMDLGIEVITYSHHGEPLLELLRELQRSTPSVETSDSTTQSVQKIEREIVVPDYGPHRSVFFVPFRQKGSEIVGQEHAIEAVRKQLTEGKRTAIGQTAAFRGLGGLGKTQLAVEYAYRYRDQYPNGVIWINADQDIDAQLIELSEKAQWVAPESDHKYKLEISQRRIRTYSNCLLIFDNLDDRRAIDAYLPEPEATPHILITSRIDHVDFFPVALDVLDQELSLELLIQEARRAPATDDEVQAAKEIGEMLGGLPLAIELAGAYLSHRTSVTFRQYQQLLAKDLRTAIPSKISSLTEHEADLYRTLKLSEDFLADESYLGEILDLLTWSGSAPMSPDLISTVLAIPRVASLVGALSLGTELRLLQLSNEVDSYSIHRLVAEVRRGEIPLEQRREWVEAICNRLGDWFQSKKEDFTQLTIFEAEIDHLRAWQQNAAHFAPDLSSRLRWLEAYPAYHRGRYLEARESLTEAQRLFDQFSRNDDELRAHLINDIAVTNDALGDYHEAIAGAVKALEIRRALFGEQHPDIAKSLHNLGSLYGRLGDYSSAVTCAEEALLMRRQLFQEPHTDIATSLDRVGRHYGELGDTQRALNYAKDTLEMRRKLFVEPHPYLATSLNNVGFWHGENEQYGPALEFSELALAMNKKLFGDLHPSIAAALNNIGEWCIRLGQSERGVDSSEKALAMYQLLFGERHPDIATSLNTLGHAHRELKDFGPALNYYQKALAMRKDLFGVAHPDIASSLESVGNLYSLKNDFAQALHYLKQALAMRGQLLGEEHPLTGRVAGNLANLLLIVNKREEAYGLVRNFLRKVSPTSRIHGVLKQLEGQLLSSAIRKGFRQPPKSGKKKAKKRRR